MTHTGRRLLQYLITGGTAAAIDIGGFALLSHARVPLVLAAACSFGAATVVNFLLTARWVFCVRPTRQRYVVFLIGAAVGLLVNVAVTYVGVTYMGLQRPPAKAVAISTTFLLNFWINARIVFHEDLA